MAPLSFAGFNPIAVDKTMRLLAILDRLDADPYLQPRVSLHGGTALNLFALNMPRLSVDIDLNYVGHADRQGMLEERPAVEKAVIEAGQDAGYRVEPGVPEHSGRSFKLHYADVSRPDHVKIDVDYLNRSPLLPVEHRTVSLADGRQVSFPVNSDIELFGGKIKALVGRVVSRDLYDCASIASIYPERLAAGDATLMRRVMLYNLSVAMPFPRPFDVTGRFAHREKEFAEAVHPVLAEGDRPDMTELTQVAQRFVDQIALPQDDAEAEYCRRAAKADFCPDLLFADYPDVLLAAERDPAAQWKMRNLATTIVVPAVEHKTRQDPKVASVASTDAAKSVGSDWAVGGLPSRRSWLDLTQGEDDSFSLDYQQDLDVGREI